MNKSIDIKIEENIAAIGAPFHGILLDAYGVFWGGNDIGVLPGCKEAMENLIDQGKIVGILSNSTQLSEKEIEKVKKHGLMPNKHFHFYITSGDVTRNLLLQQRLPFTTPRNTFWVWGSDHPNFMPHQAIFENTCYLETFDIKQADFIYVSIPHINGRDQVDIHLFEESVKSLIPYQLPMLCANPDRFAHEDNPPICVVRQGSIASLYQQFGGEVFYTGKPEKIMFDAAFLKLKTYHITHRETILMVGDTPETDILGANHAGIPSALLTETGIMAERIRKEGFHDATRKYVAGEMKPRYWIKKLSL